MHEADDSYSVRHLGVLLAGPISHTCIQYMDFVGIFNVLLAFFYYLFCLFCV